MPNETPWTPGPWGAFPFYYSGGDGDEKRLVGPSQFETVAEVRMGCDDVAGDLDANARLIAAAPTMFEALEPFAKLGRLLDGPFAPALFKDEDAVGVRGAWSENGEARTITFGDLRRAAAALAKALGQ